MRGGRDRLSGDRRVSEDDILRNSAIGAGGALLLGPADRRHWAGGAGPGGRGLERQRPLSLPPQPATILPNQIIEVRLTQDVPRGFF
ncbi:hypothetical protein [Leptolyngbya sp. O-77]|uniref:hypothetical protein n=1 Tax=Leptolyngbya sp. O-77 TaxID=1080068 RepID=UPI0012E3A072|nr:hypothetical protein [Leptolyngbya sp. O-77]